MSSDRSGSMSRREFVVSSAAAGVGLAMTPALAAQPNGPEPGWFDRPMRWAQLTLVAIDL